jgi:DNA repair exonuclease SbcCD nuclease subunit
LYNPLEKPSIDATHLPEGFDLFIDGHLHGPGTENVRGTPLVFPGSTVITQFDKTEASGEKGFYQIDADIESDKPKLSFTFKTIDSRRRFFFDDVDITGGMRANVEKKLGTILENTFEKRPLIKIKILGNEAEFIEQDVKDIERKYGDRAILRFVKDLESPEITKKVEFLRNLRDQKMSAEEIGLNMLHTNLENSGFKNSFEVDGTFTLLVDNRVDEVFNLITGTQSTLEKFSQNG